MAVFIISPLYHFRPSGNDNLGPELSLACRFDAFSQIAFNSLISGQGLIHLRRTLLTVLAVIRKFEYTCSCSSISVQPSVNGKTSNLKLE